MVNGDGFIFEVFSCTNHCTNSTSLNLECYCTLHQLLIVVAVICMQNSSFELCWVLWYQVV